MKLEELVSKYVRKNIISIEDYENIKKAAELMKEKKIGSLLVSKNNEYIGIVTERDILYKVIAEGKDILKTKVKEIMSSPLIFISKDATLKEAIEKFRKYNIRRLVVKENGKVIGIISIKALIGDIRTLDKVTEEIEEVKRITCAYCGTVFQTEKELSKHIDRVHLGAGILEERR